MVHVVSILVLMLIGRVQEIMPGSEYVKPVMLALLIGLAGHFLFQAPTPAGFRWKRRPFTFWWLFGLGMCLSLPLSLYPSWSFEFLSRKYLSTCIVVLLVIRHLSEFRRLERSTFAIVLCTLFLGAGMLIKPNEMPDPDTKKMRYTFSESYDPNDLALLVAMSVPFLFYWFYSGGMATRVITMLSGTLGLYAIYLTGSRGGLLSLGVFALFLILAVPQIGAFLRMTLLVGGLLGGLAATQTSTFQFLLLALQGQDYNTKDPDGRLGIWKRGLGYVATHPVFGVGVYCFQEAEGKLSGRGTSGIGFKWSEAHNSFLQIAAENGIPTFLAWCLMLAATMRELRRQRRALRPWRGDPLVARALLLGNMIRGSLYAYLFGGFFLSMGYLPMLYLLVAYVLALANITDNWVLALGEEELDDGDPPTDLASSSDRQGPRLHLAPAEGA